MSTRTHVQIRWMIRRDMPSVLEIEGQSFEFPWTEGDFIDALRRSNHIGMVAEVNENVVGYMIYQTRKKERELVAFAVHPECRRIGVGRSLIGRLIAKLDPVRRSRIVTPVRETNLQAQLFFRSMGFRWTRSIKDYYKECEDDAYVMEYSAVD